MALPERPCGDQGPEQVSLVCGRVLYVRRFLGKSIISATPRLCIFGTYVLVDLVLHRLSTRA